MRKNSSEEQNKFGEGMNHEKKLQTEALVGMDRRDLFHPHPCAFFRGRGKTLCPRGGSLGPPSSWKKQTDEAEDN